MVNGFGPEGREAGRGSVGQTRGHSVKRQVWRSVRRGQRAPVPSKHRGSISLSNVKGAAHGDIIFTKAPEASMLLKGHQAIAAEGDGLSACEF